MKILIVRTDHIGDLVCTTPALQALRAHYPEAHIAALVSTYSKQVLDNNSDIDKVYVCDRLERTDKSFLQVLRETTALIFQIRRAKFDYVILLGGGYRKKEVKIARFFGAKHLIGYAYRRSFRFCMVDTRLSYDKETKEHEVQQCFRLLEPLGINGTPPPLKINPDEQIVEKIRLRFLKEYPSYADKPPIGIHISCRSPSRRWPDNSFVELICLLWERYQVPIMLFWSPGSESNPFHPGDDEKAKRIIEASVAAGVPVIPCATQELRELTAYLSFVRAFICSDGGAMHIAAALAKPIVCFFDCSIDRWHPWSVKYQLLQCPLSEVVLESFKAYEKLNC
jgi:heptosyltransferase-3